MHTSPHQRTTRHPVLLGLVEAVRLDLIVVPSVFVVATAFWIVGLGAQLDYSIIPEWAFALWALVHGLSVSSIGFDFSLAPSLVTLGVWFLLAAGAARLITALSEAEPVPGTEDETPFWATCLMALAGFVVAYVGPLLALALLVGQAAVTPMGALRLLVLLATACAVGFLRVRGLVDLPWVESLDPETWATAVALVKRLLWGGAILAVLVIGGGLVLRWSDLAEAMGAYSSPLAAGIGLVVLQLLFSPGVLFGCLSWMAGIGVSIGAGGTASVFASVLGPVPQIPVLELLTGDYPVWTTAAPVLLVLLGVGSVVIGRIHARAVFAGSWLGLGIAAGILVVVLETLALFSFGAIGPLGLASFGPSPLTSAIVVTAWIGLGLSIGLVLTKLSQLEFAAEDRFATTDVGDRGDH